MMLIAVLIFALAAAALELPVLIRKRWIKETVIFSVLLVAGIALSIAAVKSVPLPSPLIVLKMVYSPISSWIFN